MSTRDSALWGYVWSYLTNIGRFLAALYDARPSGQQRFDGIGLCPKTVRADLSGRRKADSLSGRSRDRPCAQRRSRSVFAQDQIKLGRSNSPSPTAHFAMALLRWPRKMARVIIESSSKIARRCSDFPNRCSRGKTVPMHQRRTVSNGTTCLFASVRGERLVIGCADSPRSILLRCLLLRLF